MPTDEFDRERAAGVVFWGYEDRGRLAGVMGLQDVRDVSLIRHAYVAPAKQRDGIGGKLVAHLQHRSTKPMLVGTWADATWAIGFYERHGFALVTPARKTALLQSYWTIPERQIETSVVLANPPENGWRGFLPRPAVRGAVDCAPKSHSKQRIAKISNNSCAG